MNLIPSKHFRSASPSRTVRLPVRSLTLAVTLLNLVLSRGATLTLEGVHVVPHVQSTEMRYRQATDFSLGARVELFLRNNSSTPLRLNPGVEVRVRGKSPADLLAADEWAWHDFPSAWSGVTNLVPPGALTVWSWNGKRALWGTHTQAELSLLAPGATAPERIEVSLAAPTAWLSAVTFLGPATDPHPDSLLFHVVNQTGGPLKLEACRLWLPTDNSSWRALRPQAWLRAELARFPADGLIPARARGAARVMTGPLPLTYGALEVRLTDAAGQPVTLWTHQRIKRESFDISAGWIVESIGGTNTVQSEAYLKALHRLHVNTAHMADVGGYTDQTGPDGLYTRYPLKYFNRLQPLEHYDTDALLPRIHAVEFLGEPQYGGGRPVPPQEVWRALAPYASSRLPTSVTHSEERIWRFYAGLSDYPHYDAYRVTAPSPDAWGQYDRWSGQRIRWGAPLETIGEMTRSLRELNRPRPIAYWSQGAHHDWNGYGGRKRGSPTPDELRLQAYHALASRITSLYWFNLSTRSLVAFPDLFEPMARVGREIRMLEEYYLEGDAISHERVARAGRPDWDLDVVAGPRGALLFALDLAYEPDREERTFRFGPPRAVTLRFPQPAYARPSFGVFRIDADGLQPITHRVETGSLSIADQASRVAVYLVPFQAGEVERIESRRQALLAREQALGFNPGTNPADLTVLQQLVPPRKR